MQKNISKREHIMYNIAMLLCYLTLFRGDIHVHTQVATLKVNMAFGRKGWGGGGGVRVVDLDVTIVAK